MTSHKSFSPGSNSRLIALTTFWLVIGGALIAGAWMLWFFYSLEGSDDTVACNCPEYEQAVESIGWTDSNTHIEWLHFYDPDSARVTSVGEWAAADNDFDRLSRLSESEFPDLQYRDGDPAIMTRFTFYSDNVSVTIRLGGGTVRVDIGLRVEGEPQTGAATFAPLIDAYGTIDSPRMPPSSDSTADLSPTRSPAAGRRPSQKPRGSEPTQRLLRPTDPCGPPPSPTCAAGSTAHQRLARHPRQGWCCMGRGG